MEFAVVGSQDDEQSGGSISKKASSAPPTIVDSSSDCTAIHTALTATLGKLLSSSLITTITDCFDSTIVITRTNSKKGLAIRVLTPRLSLDSLTPEDTPTLVRLFGNFVVMERFAERATRKAEVVQTRVQGTLLPRWQNGDPGGGFIVRSGKTPIGFVVCAGPKQPELAFLFFDKVKDEPIWGNGYGREAVTAYVTRFIPRMIREGLLTARGIVATSSFDNPGSTGILDRLGFTAAEPARLTLEDDSAVAVGVRYNIRDKKGILRTAEKIKYAVEGEEGKKKEKIISKLHLSYAVKEL